MERIFSYLDSRHDLTRIGFIQSEESENIKSRMSAIIAENLLFEQNSGYFRQEVDMELIEQSLVGVIQRLTVTQLLPGHKSPSLLASQVIDLFLHGIVAADYPK
ncbi:hypothetical protein [Paenibacillus nasutitermitis]|uniref:Uncharacterized protein n=1 Tax=Paenibacillus nasutitermitis TaxID=1652958 RepID=A0A916YP13_9BACL|nr:hypothetical protein [Paenibacillus nasutitermitis]GGD54209.1 hypothetical protein GCM10010911_09700 [Paenibacillus nasutitermitis]